MNKKLITLAVAFAVASPMVAMAEATMYGKVRQAVEYVDDGGTDSWQIRDNGSRLGVKGSEDLGNGLTAVYKMEFGVNISGNSGTALRDTDSVSEFGRQVSDTIYNRNAYVGLTGDWGTFLVGRHDTPLKISTATLDYFSDQAGDTNTSGAASNLFGFADRRANGTVAYVSPNLSGFTFAGALVPGENPNTGADSLADAYSFAGMYSNSGLFASIAYEGGESRISDLATLLGAGAALDQWRVGLGYDAGEFKVAAAYENMNLDPNLLGPDVDIDRWYINGAYNFGNNTVKAKYQAADSNLAVVDADMWSIGFDHNFTKRTQFQASYSNVDWNARNVSDSNIFSLGLNHEF